MTSKLVECGAELYLKGIYPVEFIAFPDEDIGRKGRGCLVMADVRAKSTFLLTTNYAKGAHVSRRLCANEKRWVKAGEILKVPVQQLWPRRRSLARGKRR